MPDEPSPILPPGLTVLGTLGPEGEIDEQRIDDPEADRPTILLTGARSPLGLLLQEAWANSYTVIPLDPRPGSADDPEPVDLTTWDDFWPSLFEEVDVVVHLDDSPESASEWSDLVGPGLDAAANVLNAAGLSGVQRVILASDWRVMGGHVGSDQPIDESLPPRPTGLAAQVKAAAERVGKAAAAAFELEFIVLRLGALPGSPALPPGSSPLTDGDLVSLFTAAVEMNLPDSDFLVLHAVPGWPGDRAAELLGFRAEG